MAKILGYILSPIHLIVFVGLLLIFDPIQRILMTIGGYAWQKKAVDWLNLGLTRSLWLLGSHARFRNSQRFPTDRPLIVVANHQSLYDIPPFFWFFRKHHVKFVAKIELARGVPSISYNLRRGGNAIIDRKNPEQALNSLTKFGKYIADNKYCACIFPEGTRSRNGQPKRFSLNGFQTILEQAPDALVIPVSIQHTWKLQQYGWYPMPLGVQPSWTVHPAIEPKGRTAEAVLAEAESIIKAAL